jgi:hypothetical protein
MPGLSYANAESILSMDNHLAPEGDVVGKQSAVTKQAAVAPSAKKKTAAAKAGTQPNVLTLRGSVEWKDWLDRFAARMRTKPTAIIDLALAKLAEQERFPEPPPRM